MTDTPPAEEPKPEAESKPGETPDATDQGPDSRRPTRVLLIGWDAADWKHIDPLLEAGELPNLKRFLDEGASGNVATLQPALSPMLWTSVATGKLADKHGVLGFAEPDSTTGKSRPVTSTSRQSKAIWNILSDRGRPAGAINWYASHPAEQINGFVVTDRFAHPTGPLKPDEPMLGWPTVANSVWPADDLDPLAETRVHPAMINREMVGEFIPAALEEKSEVWPKVAELRTLLAHSTTVHNAATAYIAERDWDFMGIYYDAIDRFAHSFMEFHPPKMDHVSDEDFERYSGVMNACYRLHDLMLGRLMKLIDDDTLVILLSDHGFHSDHLRPQGTSAIKDGQPVAWHRPYGIIAFHGPGIKQGEKLYGASLLDVTPTILDALGLPIAGDMDGRALRQIWQEPGPPPERIDTYEIEGEQRDEHDPEDPAVAEKMLDQLRQLGYLGDDDSESVMIDRARNLGIVYLSTGRPREAAERFAWILERKPDDKGSKMSMLSALMGLEQYDECERLATELLEEGVDRPRIELMRAMIAARQGRDDDSLERLRSVEAMDPNHPGLQNHLGQAFLRREMWADAEKRFLRALEVDPDDANALDGLGVAYRQTERAPEAVLAHVRSIALEHHRPAAHLNLARALIDAGRIGWALEAIAVAIRMAPGLVEAHELAVRIYSEILHKPRKAAFHRKRIEQINAYRAKAEARKAAEGAGVPIPGRATIADRPRVELDFAEGDSAEPITIVSGLPRSGTSLMMQMLEAGGIEALADGEREADDDNPRGYLELEAVKDTARDPSWIGMAHGRCVKMVHTLLRSLPMGPSYEVVFMRREINEIIASQRTMLERMGRAGGGLDEAALRAAYERDLKRTLDWAHGVPNLKLIEISYNEIMSDPVGPLESLASFLSAEVDTAAMRGAIDASLYRNRKG
jgi:predicted AlkP superfamily phosphohydrolase/phosphomutase/Tfp pilus assembly protein PilF